jgi:hypothetical protein
MSAISSSTVRTHRQNHARLIAAALALAGVAAIFGFAVVLAGNGSRNMHHPAVNAGDANSVLLVPELVRKRQLGLADHFEAHLGC